MNKYSKQRKIISASKYMRIYNDNLDKVGTALIYKTHNQGWVNSLSAVKVGNFVYCTLPCKHQNGSRLETYNIKYNVEDSPLDNICFVAYPRPVQPKVDF